jgi:hypothetical protein
MLLLSQGVSKPAGSRPLRSTARAYCVLSKLSPASASILEWCLSLSTLIAYARSCSAAPDKLVIHQHTLSFSRESRFGPLTQMWSPACSLVVRSASTNFRRSFQRALFPSSGRPTWYKLSLLSSPLDSPRNRAPPSSNRFLAQISMSFRICDLS